MTNGYNCSNGYKIGSKCRVKCRAGHRHNNGDEVTCLPGAVWSGQDQECEPIPKSCPLKVEIEGNFCPISLIFSRKLHCQVYTLNKTKNRRWPCILRWK